MRARTGFLEGGFRAGDRQRLRVALRRAPDIRTYERILAVDLVAQGELPGAVARRLHRHYLSVHRWVGRYLRQHRVEDLRDGWRSGRPRQAGRLTRARVLAELRRPPFRVGFPATVWTVDRLACRLRARYGCEITGRTLRRRFKQWGLVWKRPRYVYAHKERHLAQKKGPWCGGCVDAPPARSC